MIFMKINNLEDFNKENSNLNLKQKAKKYLAISNIAFLRILLIKMQFKQVF